MKTVFRLTVKKGFDMECGITKPTPVHILIWTPFYQKYHLV